MTKCACGTRTGKPCRKNAVQGETKCAVHMRKTCYAVTSKRRSSRATTPWAQCKCETKFRERCKRKAVWQGFCSTHAKKCNRAIAGHMEMPLGERYGNPKVSSGIGGNSAVWGGEALRRSYAQSQAQPQNRQSGLYPLIKKPWEVVTDEAWADAERKIMGTGF